MWNQSRKLSAFGCRCGAGAPVSGVVMSLQVMEFAGGRRHALGVTRTPGQRFRKPLLYPPELRGQPRKIITARADTQSSQITWCAISDPGVRIFAGSGLQTLRSQDSQQSTIDD